MNSPIAVLGVVLCFLITIRFSSAICPPQEDLYPCTCTPWTHARIVVGCNNIRTTQELSRILSSLSSYEVEILYLENSKLRFLPLSSSVKFTVLKISLINSEILTSDDGDHQPFWGLGEYLEELDSRNSSLIEKGKWKLNIGNLYRLKRVDITDENIRKLTEGVASELPNGLKSLKFRNCKTEIIDDEFLGLLKHLEELSLDGNKIKGLYDKTAVLPRLRELSMRNNLIIQLPQNMMEIFPSLIELNLDDNKIIALPSGTWKDIFNKLDTILLSGNPLICDDDMKWIVKAKMPKSFQGHCAEPERLKSKRLKDLTSADFELEI